MSSLTLQPGPMASQLLAPYRANSQRLQSFCRPQWIAPNCPNPPRNQFVLNFWNVNWPNSEAHQLPPLPLDVDISCFFNIPISRNIRKLLHARSQLSLCFWTTRTYIVRTCKNMKEWKNTSWQWKTIEKSRGLAGFLFSTRLWILLRALATKAHHLANAKVRHLDFQMLCPWEEPLVVDDCGCCSQWNGERNAQDTCETIIHKCFPWIADDNFGLKWLKIILATRTHLHIFTWVVAHHQRATTMNCHEYIWIQYNIQQQAQWDPDFPVVERPTILVDV